MCFKPYAFLGLSANPSVFSTVSSPKDSPAKAAATFLNAIAAGDFGDLTTIETLK